MGVGIDAIAELPAGMVRPLRREEYDRLVAAGVFEGERLELLLGVLVAMTPQDPRHAAVVQRLNRLLSRALGDRSDVRVQLPLAVSDVSEPEPDIAVVPRGDTDDAHPSSAHLVVEVAWSSLATDGKLKAGLYAEAGVPEYWLVDVAGKEIEVHRGPSAGRYAERAARRRGETIRLVAFPDVAIDVADVVR